MPDPRPYTTVMGWSERISAVRWLAAVAIFSSLCSTGCSDSEKSADSASGSAVVEKPLPPLSVDRAMSVPGAWRQEDVFVKPGHWSGAWVEAASNAGDFQGELELRIEDRAQTAVESQAGPGVRRPLVLSRGEPKVIEGAFFRPWRKIAPDTSTYYSPSPNAPDVACSVSLLSRGGRRSELTTSLQTTALKNHQAIFGVLAAKPEKYSFYAGLDVISAPHLESTSSDAVHYRLAIAEEGLRAPLPSQATGWTTVAYLLWDGYDPARFSDAQREAMLDWLHWGGQLLISGPASLVALERSFLAPYLPARDGGTVTLERAALEPLQQWVPPRGRPFEPSHAWPAVKLVPHEGADTLVPADGGANPLVVERSVGRGRIVVTSFGLSEPDLADWPSFDSLLHGCLMRRPPRTLVNNGFVEGLRWVDIGRSWFDPTRISNVRYVVRDEGREGRLAKDARDLQSMYDMSANEGAGVAAWRDDGPVVNSARELLRSEAGIVIPDARFVINVVGAYFLVLVPLNWLIFRLLGKPEWAWFAAPLIAVGCSAVVVRLAELDVGFARSTSETTIVELQPGSSRAHVSRFIAVYNSLGTDYEIRGDDSSTTALPLAADPNGTSDSSTWRIGRIAEGEIDRTSIQGFLVESNSAAMLRAEQMRDLGGGIGCERLADGRYRITNGTRLELTDCRIMGAAVGRLERIPAGASIEVRLEAPPGGAVREDESSLLEKMRGALATRATDELRLIGLATGDVGGFAFSPQPSQIKRTTFVVAHLEYRNVLPQLDGGGRSSLPRDRTR